MREKANSVHFVNFRMSSAWLPENQIWQRRFILFVDVNIRMLLSFRNHHDVFKYEQIRKWVCNRFQACKYAFLSYTCR